MEYVVHLALFRCLLCPVLPSIWNKTWMLSCRAHLSVEMCIGTDVSGGSANYHPACNEDAFPKKSMTSKKKSLLLHLCPC